MRLALKPWRDFGRQCWLAASFALGLSVSCCTPEIYGAVSAPREDSAALFPLGQPAFDIAVERLVGNRSAHFTYSLAAASYRMMLSHNIPVTDASITHAVRYVLQAREIAGPRLLFGNGTQVVNILHEYDPFDGMFDAAAVIRKELGMGAQPQDIWTYQGPTEIAPALKTIANSRGPMTIYIYAHGSGHTFRVSDRESLQLTQLADALRRRGNAWTNVLADECDGVITYLPSELRGIGAEVPSYVVSSTARGAMARGSRLLNALSGTGAGTGTYFMDPRRPEFEDLARAQDFILIWTPTQSQKRQLERVWPFPNVRIDAQSAEVYPAWVWELA
jgi:hypothetical protein